MSWAMQMALLSYRESVLCLSQALVQSAGDEIAATEILLGVQ